MVTVISRFRVGNGMEEAVARAFLERPRLVQKAAGFCGLEVMTDSADPSVFLLLTRWTSEAAFRVWHTSEAHHDSHRLIPKGLKLDAAFTQVVVGNRIEEIPGAHLEDALEGRAGELSRWLMESDVVFALFLAADGTILMRNRAANRIFAHDSEDGLGLTVWDYLIPPDAEYLRDMFSAAARTEDCFTLNLLNGMKDPISTEASLIGSAEGFLLLGAIEQRHSQRLQDEMKSIANQLSNMTRELSRKNRQLEETNKIIERVSRTDALTGLATRGAFYRTLENEMTRAVRQQTSLTLIMADLDHFKAINDLFGHIAGDHILARVGGVFVTQSRPYDLAARYGGEEFALLLPGITTEEGVTVAERIRKDISLIHLDECETLVRISLGVATLQGSESAEALVARADSALYRAKAAGGDCVEFDGLG